MAGLLAVSAALAALAPARHVRAEQGGVALDWEAPPGCPSRDAVLRRIRAMVGASLDQASRLRARGRIERSNARYRLTLEVRDGKADTERVIESSSCADLAGAAAVNLGLLVRAEAEAREKPGSDATKSEAPSTPGDNLPTTRPAEAKPAPRPDSSAAAGAKDVAPAPEPPVAAAPPADSARTWRLLLRAPLVGLDVGPLPHPIPTLGVAAGVSFEALELAVGARVGLGQTISVDASPSYGADVRRHAAEFRACYAFRSRRLAAAPCLLASVALLTASGVGSEVSSRTERTAMFAAGAAALGRLQLSDFSALVASVGLEVETARAHIVIEGLREVTQLSPLSFTTSLGLEWSL